MTLVVGASWHALSLRDRTDEKRDLDGGVGDPHRARHRPMYHFCSFPLDKSPFPNHRVLHTVLFFPPIHNNPKLGHRRVQFVGLDITDNPFAARVSASGEGHALAFPPPPPPLPPAPSLPSPPPPPRPVQLFRIHNTGTFPQGSACTLTSSAPPAPSALACCGTGPFWSSSVTTRHEEASRVGLFRFMHSWLGVQPWIDRTCSLAYVMTRSDVRGEIEFTVTAPVPVQGHEVAGSEIPCLDVMHEVFLHEVLAPHHRRWTLVHCLYDPRTEAELYLNERCEMYADRPLTACPLPCVRYRVPVVPFSALLKSRAKLPPVRACEGDNVPNKTRP